MPSLVSTVVLPYLDPDPDLSPLRDAVRWEDLLASGAGTELSWGELRAQVAATAAGLRALGVQRGDRVVAYLPNIPEAIVASSLSRKMCAA